MPPRQTFSQRIQTRRRIWWGEPSETGARRLTRFGPHQWRDLYVRRRRDDPEEAWRCCSVWQRKLINNWNSREFILRHGGRVPALYWCARLPSQRRLNALPSHFVIRPLWGSRCKGVYTVADGCDLLLQQPFSAAVLRASLLRAGLLTRISPVMAEEFIRSDDPRYQLPIEYKCHTFGNTVAAIQVIEREPGKKARVRYYTADWQPIADRMHTGLPQSPPRDPPPCLDEMLGLATCLGLALGTYVRIDFFATPRLRLQRVLLHPLRRPQLHRVLQRALRRVLGREGSARDLIGGGGTGAIALCRPPRDDAVFEQGAQHVPRRRTTVRRRLATPDTFPLRQTRS